MKRLVNLCIVVTVSGLLLMLARSGDRPKDGFTIQPGPINGVVIERDGARLAVYGLPKDSDQKFDHVLLTHHRRDAVWAASQLIDSGARVIAPAAERELLEKPAQFWDAFEKGRFHDYGQQTTKVVAEPLPVDRWVKEGDVIRWHGLEFRVLDTPGYTPGAVSYVVELDGKRVVFTGDLIYGDGQLIDLYSFQDAIPEAKIRGYHGYAGRLAMLIPSLKKVAALKPDLLVPARGPVIRNPQEAINKLIGRVQAVYGNYLSTNALNWYFKEERMKICGERVLGKEAEVQLMSYSLHKKQPDWIWEQNTTRMIISKEGHGFLLDCGYKAVIDAAKEMIRQGRIQKIEGIFVTHCHDDHTDFVQAAAEEFRCPVYALEEYQDVLANPDAYHIPALSPNAIKNIRVMKDGQSMKWREFQLTFHFYPGQMYHHGALLVKRNEEKPVFFIGDSFSPSGIDDYCLQNRNLVHEDGGYLKCLKTLRGFQGNYWLVNEHIPFVFSFSDEELNYLESRYRDRLALLRQLFPWDDPNYGIDEQWAVVYPYFSTTTAGETIDLEVRLTNHSPNPRTFSVTPRLPAGMKVVKGEGKITLGARQSGAARFQVQVPRQAGDYLVTADVESQGMAFRDWVEGMVRVK
jgi:glyoxylase-like metal-dependent hydrolase (beta-lactamase superfamily II)